MTTNGSDTDNNNSISDDLIGIDNGNTGAATYSDGANGDFTASYGTVSEAMDPAPLVQSASPATGPVLSGGNNSVDCLPGGSEMAVDAKLAVGDAQSTTLAGATMAICAGFFAGDTLSFNSQNGIFGSYNASTGVLTLTGTASLASYQAALESIRFSSTNVNPTNAGTDVNRTISWTVTDGTQSSNATSAIIVGLLDGVEGAFAVYDIRNNTVLTVENLGQLGLAWKVAGFGDFSGNANETDMLMRDSNTGAFEVYDINGNTVTSATAMGQVGLEWRVAGFGDFSGIANETDMLLRNSNADAFEVYDISHNAVTSAASLGAVGLEWTVAGFGDFIGNANETDMLLRDSNTGTFEVYDISHNAVTSAASLGAVGLEWTVAGFGDFSGNANETDMLLRDSNTGAFEVYDISHNAVTSAASLGAVGLEWTVAGFGDFSGNANETDMLLRNSNTGAFDLYDISNNMITSALPIGAIGSEWAVSGFGDFSNTPGEADLLMRDTTLETATIIPPLGPLGSSAAATATFVVNGDLDPDFTGTLTLTDGTFSTVLAYTGNGSYTANLESWPNGTVTASLAVVDSYNNSFTTSTMVAIDPDYGAMATVTGPPGTLGSASAPAVPFTVTTPDGGTDTGSLTLTDGTFHTTIAVTGNGTYTENLSNWPNGPVSATLTVGDPAGNSFTASTTVAIDPDFGETVGLSGPPGTLGSSAAAAAKFVVTGNLDANYSGSLTLTDGASSTALPYTGDGTYTANLDTWPNGTVAASLAVTDPAGNRFSATATAALDTEFGATATLTVTNPNETVGHATVSFTIGGIEAIDNNLAGSTAMVTFAEVNGNTITDMIAAPLLGHTYTQSLAIAAFPTAGMVTASLTFTDAASNTLTATASPGVTLIPPAPQFGPTDGDGPGGVMQGGIEDLAVGTITLVVADLTAPDVATQTLLLAETASNATISWLSTISYNQAGVGNSYSLQAYEQGGATVNQAGNGLAPAGAAGSPINLALTNLALTDPGGGEPVAVTIAGVPAGWSLNAGTNLGNGTWAVETSDPSSLAVTTPATFAGAVVLTVSESWTNPDGGTGSARIADNVEAYAPGNAIFALSGDDTLTGSGANDVFVFARPIGSDTIDNFNPASDRIDLVGFANVASFADIQASLADDANGNAVITLGNGETITITGVGSAALSAANFLLNQEPVTTNAGTMTIADGAMLPLGGTVDNSATIALASAGGGATLQVQASGVTLQGGGQVVLSDDGRNLVTAADPSAVLTNVDNTISGAGELGAGQLTLDNRGVIDATGANALVIDTGGNVVANSGTLEATGSGGLMVAGAVANSGTLAADGGNLTVEGAVSGSGGAGAEISGGATLEFGAASSANVGFAAGAAGMLKLDQASGFSGTVAGLGAGDAIDLADIAFGGGDTLAYAANAAGTGGVLSVSDGTHAANLALLGQYAASEFATAPDPGGGTVLTYGPPPPSGTTDQALLAHPPH